ncbi:MAG: hypothetical protein E6Q25_08425 [Acinetobacter sp.]|nr:MAG: hypothetical protein E6Q25_08425 [Acinetobacter sp.]
MEKWIFQVLQSLFILNLSILNSFASEKSHNYQIKDIQIISRIPNEDWGRAREFISQPDWSAWLRNRRLQLDHWMHSNNEEHDKSVGWMHDYVQAESGRFIPWSPESAAPLATDTKRLAAWRAHVRSYNIAQIREAARIFRLTGDARYLAWARSQLNAYAANYGFVAQIGYTGCLAEGL